MQDRDNVKRSGIGTTGRGVTDARGSTPEASVTGAGSNMRCDAWPCNTLNRVCWAPLGGRSSTPEPPKVTTAVFTLPDGRSLTPEPSGTLPLNITGNTRWHGTKVSNKRVVTTMVPHGRGLIPEPCGGGLVGSPYVGRGLTPEPRRGAAGAWYGKSMISLGVCVCVHICIGEGARIDGHMDVF